MEYRESKLMRSVRSRLGQPLEQALPPLINEKGITVAAEDLGISKATLGYWLLKMGITVHRVAVRPGESLEVRRDLAKAD